MTAVEKIISEINNELLTLESLHGSEIIGRKIGLAFAKRVAGQALKMEKEQQNNLPIHIHEGISNTQVYIEDGVVHVKPNETLKSE